jgi:hypothetical protein
MVFKVNLELLGAGVVLIKLVYKTVGCAQDPNPKTNNKATTPAVRRKNFFNKFSVGFVARVALNFTVDAVCTRDTREYNDFMPVAV